MRGFEPLIDRSEIYAFEDWWLRIEALIAQADTIVFVISPDAVTSDVCHKEVAFAASLHPDGVGLPFKLAVWTHRQHQRRNCNAGGNSVRCRTNGFERRYP